MINVALSLFYSANCLAVRKTQFLKLFCELFEFQKNTILLCVGWLSSLLCKICCFSSLLFFRSYDSAWHHFTVVPCNVHVHKEQPTTTLQQCEPRRNNCSYNCWFVRIQKARTDNAFAHVLQNIQSFFCKPEIISFQIYTVSILSVVINILCDYKYFPTVFTCSLFQ